jgi:hypothetical protein
MGFLVLNMAGPIGDIIGGIVGLIIVKKGVDTITSSETSGSGGTEPAQESDSGGSQDD